MYISEDCSQPMKEEYLLTNKLEPTNEPYAIAKISGIKLCKGIIVNMVLNFYLLCQQIYMVKEIILTLNLLTYYQR